MRRELFTAPHDLRLDCARARVSTFQSFTRPPFAFYRYDRSTVRRSVDVTRNTAVYQFSARITKPAEEEAVMYLAGFPFFFFFLFRSLAPRQSPGAAIKIDRIAAA